MMSPLIANGSSLTTAGTLYYAFCGNNSTGDGTEANRSIRVSVAGSAANFRIALEAGGPGAGDSWIFTIFKNGIATALTITISGTDTTGSFTASAEDFAVGDTISLEVAETGTPTSRRWGASLEYTSDTPNEQMILGFDNGFDNANPGYEWPAGRNNGVNATEAQVGFLVAAPGTVSHFYVKTTAAAGTGNSTILTHRKGAADQALTVTISGAAEVTDQDTTNSYAVVAGNLIDISCTPVSTPNVGIYLWSFKFTPTTAGESILAALCENISGDEYGSLQSQGRLIETELGGTPLPAGILKSEYVDLTVAPGVGDSWNARLQNGGSSGALTVTVAETATTGNDTTHSQAVAAGDKIRFFVDETGTAAATYARLGVVFSTSSSAIKTWDGLATASHKTHNGLAVASRKTINGLA